MTTKNKYIAEVRKNLSCSSASKEQLFHDILPLIDDFSELDPDAGFSAYVREFGQPEALAGCFLDTLNQEEVLRFRKKSTRKHRVLRFAGAAAFLLAAGALVLTVILHDPPGPEATDEPPMFTVLWLEPSEQ